MAIDFDNYIYSHHTKQIYRLPMYPEAVNDAISAIYQTTTILARSAPIQSWTSSGPRSVRFSLLLHRDLDYEGLTEAQIEMGQTVGDINRLFEEYQSLSLPNYSSPMLVEPPMITVRLGKNIRITGIPDISLVNKLPINSDGIYQVGEFSFEIREIDPYDAVKVYSSYKNARGPDYGGRKY